jgi:hypothetical protein
MVAWNYAASYQTCQACLCSSANVQAVPDICYGVSVAVNFTPPGGGFALVEQQLQPLVQGQLTACMWLMYVAVVDGCCSFPHGGTAVAQVISGPNDQWLK